MSDNIHQIFLPHNHPHFVFLNSIEQILIFVTHILECWLDTLHATQLLSSEVRLSDLMKMHWDAMMLHHGMNSGGHG